MSFAQLKCLSSLYPLGVRNRAPASGRIFEFGASFIAAESTMVTCKAAGSTGSGSTCLSELLDRLKACSRDGGDSQSMRSYTGGVNNTMFETGKNSFTLLSSLQCPALSLQHNKVGEDSAPVQDRKKAEEYAATLLTRPLLFSPASMEQGQKDPMFVAASIGDIPNAVLQNVSDSFNVLVDCRLRAYASFLARVVGVDLDMEQKVSTLLETGRNMVLLESNLTFELQDEDDEAGSLVDDDYARSETDQLQLKLLLTMQLELTQPSGSKRTVGVRITAPGNIRETSQASSSKVIIDLDTHELLLEMIDQASLVVATVVELANTACIVPESKLCRSSSFLEMPPPLPKRRKPCMDALELLSQAAAGLVSISEPTISCPVYSRASTEHLVVVSDDETEQDLLQLSPDQCASIVDGVFKELDDDYFCLGPPAKRFKPE